MTIEQNYNLTIMPTMQMPKVCMSFRTTSPLWNYFPFAGGDECIYSLLGSCLHVTLSFFFTENFQFKTTV